MNSASVSMAMLWSRSIRSAWREAIKALGDGRLALVGRVRRQPGRQGSGDDAGLGHAFLGGQFIEPLGVLGLDKEVQAIVAHSSIPSLGSRDASRAVRCMAGSSWRGKRQVVVVIEQAEVGRGRGQLGVVGDGLS